MKHRFLFVLFSIIFFFRAAAQETYYPITNYSTRDYGLDFHPTNLAIVQDHRGIIYAANSFKLLEFDGSGWKSYPINTETWILSLAVDVNGIIYVGSQNEFGLFEPDYRGELKYRSLSDSLETDDIGFSNIWKVLVLPEGVVFQAEEKLVFYKSGVIEVVQPETSFHTSFVVNDKLYVRQREVGLMEWQRGSLVKVNESELFDTTGIFIMVPYDSDGTILIGTRDKGFWLFDPDGESNLFRKFEVRDENLIQKSIITGGALTGNGEIAISTMLNGVLLMDKEGNLKQIINHVSGLADDDVKQLIVDRSQNLWLALNNGISRVEISSPIS